MLPDSQVERPYGEHKIRVCTYVIDDGGGRLVTVELFNPRIGKWYILRSGFSCAEAAESWAKGVIGTKFTLIIEPERRVQY